MIRGISLGSLPSIFDKCGFSEEKMLATLTVMVSYWIKNDPDSDITAEFIQSEMDMEPFATHTMIREGLRQLNETAWFARDSFLTGRLIRYTVHPHTILLEMDDEPERRPES